MYSEVDEPNQLDEKCDVDEKDYEDWHKERIVVGRCFQTAAEQNQEKMTILN